MTHRAVLLPFRRPAPTTAGPTGPRRTQRRHGGRRLARDVAVSAPTRARRADLLRWCLANGRSIDSDAASVIVAVLHELDGRRVRLTDDLMTELVWIDGVRWCDENGVDRPSGFAATMHALVDFAFATGWAHRDSDSADDLHEVIESVGAPLLDNRRRPVPTA